MSKKVFVVLLAAVLTASYAQAQFTFGVRAGFNLTDFSGDGVEDSKMKPGFQIGVVGDLALSDNFSIQPGLLFATQGAKWSENESEGDYKVSYSESINLNYLQIPINAQYKLDLGDMKLLLQAGPYFGYGISGKYKWEESWNGNKESGDDKIEFGSDEEKHHFKALDLGLGFGAGLQFGNIQAGVGYNLGLANLAHSDNYKIKNNGLAITVTYLFGK